MTESPIERRRVQCCIAGGGPAGVMAGALLARAGVSVLVLEKHGDFLRDFRGDTVHPSTLDVLDELGWLQGFLERPHQELPRIRAHVGNEEVALADFSHLAARCKFIALMPQWDFLDFLVQRAREFRTFELWMNATVRAAVERDGKVCGVRGERAGAPFEIEADLVLAADGRHSTLRAQSGLQVRDLGAPIDVLWLRLSRRADDPAQSLGWVQPGRFMVLLDRGDYWQVAYVIPKGGFARVQERGLDAFRQELAATAPFLTDRVRELETLDDVRLLEVKVDRLQRWWRPGLLCIGDAAHAMSPVGGVGINLAIQDAVAAANLLAGPLSRGAPSGRELARVQRRRELPTRLTQSVQLLVQNRIVDPVLGERRPLRVGPLLHALRRWPWLQRVPARIVGSGIRPEHVRSVGPG